MNILDENVLEDQRRLLRKRGFAVRQIGYDIGRSGMSDEDIITLLHKRKRTTFFTRDSDYFDPELCHASYCLVWLDVGPTEVANYASGFLRHAEFRTKAQRAGKVIRLSPLRIVIWQQKQKKILMGKISPW